jgi:hypothetical protein
MMEELRMKPDFDLTKDDFNTSYAPLCVLGQAMWARDTLTPLRDYELISLKSCDHTPGEKLMDAFLLILAGYPSLYLLNSTLRADPMVAQSWHREVGLAEQSNVSRTLDACRDESLAGLRTLSQDFWRVHSQLPVHDWRKRLTLDLDLTPLPASAKAEESTKGYVGKKMKPGDNWHG